MFFIFYSYGGIFCMKCLILTTAVGGIFADYHFFTQLSLIFIGGFGEIF